MTALAVDVVEAMLQVYDAHGTPPAAAWAGCHREAVRQRVVESGRPLPGRGHPNLAELARRAPRPDCPCPMCVDIRQRAEEQERAAAVRRRSFAARQVEQAEATPDRWRLFAACADPDVDPAWFFPTDTETDKAVKAKAVCAGCSVREKCLTYSIPAEDFGIWGGLGQRQRLRLRKRTTGAAA
jgi:WhiB family redox-sensing transcriptional regulator